MASDRLQQHYLMLTQMPATSLGHTATMIDLEIALGMRTPGVGLLTPWTKMDGDIIPEMYRSDRDVSMFRDAHGSSKIADLKMMRIARDVRSSRALREHAIKISRLPDKKAVDAYKSRYLPAMTPSASFRDRRGKDRDWRHSGHVIIDVDGVDDAADLRDRLASSPQVALAFVSPSGRGLKVIVAVSPIPDTNTRHEAAYNYARVAVGRLLRRRIDVSRDVTRLCFMTSDPECLSNPDPEPLLWRFGPERRAPRRGKMDYKDTDLEGVERALMQIDADDYDKWYRIAAALQGAFGEEGFGLFDKWSRRSSKYQEGRVRWQWEKSKSMTKVGLGTIFYEAKGSRYKGLDLPERF